jgi:hypothetical protein
MIRAVRTSRGLVVAAFSAGWGDRYEVALFDDDLGLVASDDGGWGELLRDSDLVNSLAAIGLPAGEAAVLGEELAPAPPEQRRRGGWLRRGSSS